MIEGSSGNIARGTNLPMLSGTEPARQHRGPTGKPCVVVNGEAHAQVLNPKMFEHVISANNSCSQNIKLQVCYYHSEHCVPLSVASYARSQAILGIAPAMKEFRFEYREQFP